MKKLTATLILAGAACASQATLLGYDGFEGYVVGDEIHNTTNGQNTALGTGWTTNAWLLGPSNGGKILGSTESLNYTDSSGNSLVTSPGSVDMGSGGSKADYLVRYFDNSAFTNNTVDAEIWISFIASIEGPADDKDIFGFGLGDSFNSNPSAAHNFGAKSFNVTEGNGEVGIRYTNKDFTSENPVSMTNAALYVFRLNYRDYTGSSLDPLDLWINPDITSTNTLGTPYISTNLSINLPTFVQLSRTRGSSVIFDEVRVGTTFADVAPIQPPPTEIEAEIASVSPFSAGVLELVVSTPIAAVSYPKTKLNLTAAGAWMSVAHSPDGTAPFVVTNLTYSTVSGDNFVIYVESTNSAQFFNIGNE